jgi:hypothetical protein
MMVQLLKTSLFSALVAGLLAAGPVFAQEAHTGTRPFIDTRSELTNILAQYPPKLGMVLAVDPSLLGNADFLSSYPELRAFLQRHPEIARDPDFFIRGRANGLNSVYVYPQEPNLPETARLWREFFRTVVPFVVFFTALAVLSWIVRSVMDHRRWLRVSRIQAEAHTKVMDRLTNNEDLLAYLQTPAGKGFFDMSAIPTDFGPTRSAAPVTRILWSVQIGLVLLFGGVALQWSSESISQEASEPIGVISVLGIALGASFILGAGASYVISDKLGLLEKRVLRAPHRSETSPPPS